MTRHTFSRIRNIFIVLFAAGVFSVAPYAHAASISVTPQSADIYAGTPFQMTVSLSTDSEASNAIDGEISIPSDIQIVDITTGNSPITLWPVGPVYVVSDHKIEFTGGKAGGLPENSQNTLFTFTAITGTQGTYDFSAIGAHIYKNDGTGAQVSLPDFSAKVSVGPAVKGATLTTAPDHVPPVFTAYAVGRDPALFNNAYFATFYATDAGSGIAYYEVQEGAAAPFVRAERYYILRDQTLSQPITIHAVDHEGNIATAVIPAAHPRISILAYSVLGLVILTILGMLLYVRKHH